jgi:hypothetical protein
MRAPNHPVNTDARRRRALVVAGDLGSLGLSSPNDAAFPVIAMGWLNAKEKHHERFRMGH